MVYVNRRIVYAKKLHNLIEKRFLIDSVVFK